MVHSCNLSTWEVEARKAKVQDHTQLHGKLKTSLSYLNKEREKENKRQRNGRLFWLSFGGFCLWTVGTSQW